MDNYCENNFNIFKGSPILELENINDEIYTDEKETLKVYIESKSVSIIFPENKMILKQALA
ncbi:hypothetical protein [Clostridium felsineum]|uniref:hypothetical protein n=1 Tax=Clostridium felsineum TaxID=36839 RepID=UPI00098CA01B|nr:hypothetical protein [Clostridium felsineum]URZ03829.1 hypothetical protein CLAUR_038940 [Clostridium felsineum]